MNEGKQEKMLLKLILSVSADPLKDDIQNCQDKHEEDVPKASPFGFVIKQFQGKKSSPGKGNEQPSAIKKFFWGLGKSEGKDRTEIEETEINSPGADDQSEKQDPSVEGNVE